MEIEFGIYLNFIVTWDQEGRVTQKSCIHLTKDLTALVARGAELDEVHRFSVEPVFVLKII